jgi:MFS family permease
MTKFFSIRFILAFLIAPISPGVVAYLISLARDEITHTEFIFGIAITIGYGFAIFLGLPFYYFYIKKDKLSYINMLFFAVLCTVIVGIIFVGEPFSTPTYEQILSPSQSGYLLVFFMAAFFASSVFYLIMNFKLEK